MPTTCKLIAKNVLGSDSASTSFTSIPATYDDLIVIVSGRSTISALATDLFMGINGSTSNFTTRFLYGTGASALSSAQSQRYAGTLVGATATSNTFASNEIYIPNYRGSTNKSISATAVSENNGTTAYILAFATLWSNTAAITSLEFASNSGNIATGSSFFLYGITKA